MQTFVLSFIVGVLISFMASAYWKLDAASVCGIALGASIGVIISIGTLPEVATRFVMATIMGGIGGMSVGVPFLRAAFFAVVGYSIFVVALYGMTSALEFVRGIIG